MSCSFKPFWPAAVLLGCLPWAGGAEPLTLPSEHVLASRGRLTEGDPVFVHERLSASFLGSAQAGSLDAALRAVPEFSLFRRLDSLAAHPSVQGLSLRGLGPSGASRSLVLLDGLPLNDPFGGWIPWSRIPRQGLAGAEISYGGGAGAWGSPGLAGVLALFREDPGSRMFQSGMLVGGLGRLSADVQAGRKLASGGLEVQGSLSRFDGRPLLSPEQRGPIDQAVGGEAATVSTRWLHTRPDGLRALVSADYFEENRWNGTPYQVNAQRAGSASLDLGASLDRAWTWNLQGYVQTQDSESRFSSVNSARSLELPSADQYAVPCTAGGLSVFLAHVGSSAENTQAGIEFRGVEGEARERYAYVSGAYTRERRAGGEQTNLGFFVRHQQVFPGGFQGLLGLRFDRWEDRDGHLELLAHGVGVSSSTTVPSSGLEFSPLLGVLWRGAGWTLRSSLQQASRRPTLNELYRPFRVGNVATEANPRLGNEQARSLDLAANFEQGTFSAGLGLQYTELRNAVANVTHGQGPVQVPGIGFIPAGGEWRRRESLDLVYVHGLSWNLRWTPSSSWRVEWRQFLNESDIRVATAAPSLVGRQLPQVPRLNTVLSCEYQPRKTCTLSVRLRALSSQYEDDLNRLELAGFNQLDLGLQQALGVNLDLFLLIENATDARVENSRSPEGLVTLAAPRVLTVGLSYRL